MGRVTAVLRNVPPARKTPVYVEGACTVGCLSLALEAEDPFRFRGRLAGMRVIREGTS